MKFLVVSHPPKRDRPQMNQLLQQSSYVVADPPRITWQVADTPEEAAERAGVRPGGWAEVCPEAEVKIFKRPAEAPLQAA